jgi:tetratricopeptide (TPR) repeat protein
LQNYTEATQLIEGLAAADPQDKGHLRWLAVTYLSVGELFSTLGQPDKALENYRKAMAISEKVFADDSDRAETRRDLARIYEAMGLLFANNDQPVPALEYFRKAESMASVSASHDPQNGRVRLRFARILAEMAAFFRNLGDQRDPAVGSHNTNLHTALDLYRRSLGIWQDLRNKGMLSSIDLNKPEELAKEIAHCEAALSSIEREKRVP